ncbi:hypothetical protein BDZ91DRAFT_175333 [Kalaharituber pfeilii]|nr:hypothetical protein BDZ91DRAFT_175333 [Kalaharituber pfeilii]
MATSLTPLPTGQLLHCFVKNYSARAKPLISLMGNVPFLQGDAQRQSFDELKQAFLITQYSAHGIKP